MKRWAILTVALYLVCISTFAVLMLLLFSGESDWLPIFYIFFVPFLIIIQAVLLLVPVAVVHERPIKRRKVVVSAVIGAIPMGAMALGFIGSVILMIWGENAVDEYLYHWSILIIPVIFWSIWGVMFYRSFSSGNPRAFTSIITRWLLRGSILELLVAIPSHIISRQRGECCAPPFTFIGIVTGLSIALMSFGPGVYFLFAKKIQRKKETGKTIASNRKNNTYAVLLPGYAEK